MHQYSKPFKISSILHGYVTGNLNAEQEQELNLWINESPANKALFEELINPDIVGPKLKEMDLINKSEIWEKTLKKLQTSKLGFSESEKVRQKTEGHHLISLVWSKLAIAVTVLISIGIGIWIYNRNQNPRNVQHAVTDVQPGGSGATLTLADGRKIKLSEVNNGAVVSSDAGSKVDKTADGKLLYTESSANTKETNYNVLATSYGERYQLRLPDSTKVWLNAGSKIKFPTSFKLLKSRTVELTGEAYFEVAKDKAHPFIVKTDRQEVQVLGTHFNVTSYPDDHKIKTTLLEGSVRITSANKSSVVLSPGEQAVNINSAITVNEISPENAIAWKSGEFVFVNEDLESIMKIIARWYDLELYWKDPSMKTKTFYARVSCFKKLSDVLKKFELTEKVSFTVRGRRIYVDK